MARVTSLGINIFSHWSGRGMRQARRNLNQLGDGITDTNKDARRFNRSINRMSGNSRLLARSLKKPHKNLSGFNSAVRVANRSTNRLASSFRSLGRVIRRPSRGIRDFSKAVRGADRDSNMLSRSLRALGRAALRPANGFRRLRSVFGRFGDEMVSTANRGRALGFIMRSLLIRAALALAPALLPIINVLARLTVGLGAMATAAVIGFGGFGAAMFAASKHALTFRGRLNKASKAQRAHIRAVDGTRKAWEKFLNSRIGGRLLVPMNIALKAITRNMGKLKPLVSAIAPIIRNIARRFANWMDRSNGFARFVRVMKKHGVPIMRNLARASRSVLKFLGRAFRDSLPLARKLSKAIREGARKLAKWGADGGFKRWLKRAKKDGPAVRKFFKELRKLMPKLLKAIREMAPVSLKLATAFLKIVNSLSPGQIKALMWAFILAKPALIAFKLASWGVSGALFLMRRRAKRAGTAISGAGGSAKKGKGRFGKLGGAVKGAGGWFKSLAVTIGVSLLPKMGGLLATMGGGTGLIAMMRGAGLAGLGLTAAIGLLNAKHGRLSLSIDDTIKSIQDEWHQLEMLGGHAKDAGNALADVASDQWSMITPWHDGGDDVEKGATALNKLGKGAKNASKSTRKYANSLKGANKRQNGLGGGAKKARKHLRGFSSGLDRSYKAARNFGKGNKKSGDSLGKLSKKTGMSRKELKKMGITGKDAKKMLNDFGKGAVKTGKDVKNKAGGAFRNGAKNLKKNWGGATNFVRRTTRSRLLKTIHQTRAFRNKLGRVFNGIKKDIKKKWGKTFDGLAKTAKRKFNAAEKQAKQFKKTVGRQFDRTKKAIKKSWNNALDNVKKIARKRLNKVENEVKKFRKTVVKNFERTKKAIKKSWNNALDNVRKIAKKRLNKVESVVKKFRKDVVKAFERIKKQVKKSWNNTLDNVRTIAKKRLNNAMKAFKGFRKDVVQAFERIGKAVKKSWNNVLDGVRNRAKKRLGEVRKTVENQLKKIRQAFDKSADAIKKIWQGRLPEIFKKPIKFFVETVYNKGLRKAWNNTFANLPGIKELKKGTVSFASGGLAQRGGRVRGAGGPTADKIPARLSAGEYVIRAKAVKQIGVDVLNRVNQGVGGDLPKRGVPKRKMSKRYDVQNSHFADGGMLGARSRNNRCSYYRPLMLAEGGFIPYPSIDIGQVYDNAIKSGVKAAKKSKMLGTSGPFSFSGGNMSNGDANSKGAGGFDWGTNLYQDVAAKVAKNVLHPFMNTAFRARKGSLSPAGDWAEVAPENLKKIMPELVAMVVAAANVGCGTNGFAPFRPWRSGDGNRVSFRGVTLDKRTRDMCQASEKKLGKRMSYFQGSWSSAAASAGTHAGGGAVDVGPASFKTSGAMRASGFAAWARGSKFGSGSFSPHVHGIAVGNKNLSGPAAAQVRMFNQGKDGLAGGGPDNQPGGGGSCNIGGSGVKRWSALACMALKMGGCGCNKSKLSAFLRLMGQESGGNPNAINNWDSNAAAGNASRGLMQVIPSTFKANHVAGTSSNIFDPLANMAASVRYIKRRYGCRIPQAPYAEGGFVTGGNPKGGHPNAFCGGGMLGMLNNGVSPRIFDRGGWLRPGLNVVDNRTGGPEHLERTDKGHTCGGPTIVFNKPVYAKSEREFRDMILEAYSDLKRRGRV